MPRRSIWKGAKFLLTKSIAYIFVLFIAPVLWDWGLAWVSPLVVFYEEFLSFLLSSMDRLPLYGGGGSSDAGPSRRLDLNRIPSPSPEPEPPAEPPAEPEIPRLDQPLISDRERFIELQERFHVYYLGRNRITDLAEFAGRLERAVPIEINIEATLVFDGYDPDRIRGRINEIRGILFTHPTRALLLSEQTLDLYLNEILTNGTRQSAPYMRVVRAILDSYLIL